MRIALLTTDHREHDRKYELTQPYFGPAIEALLQGFAELPELEVHVVSCAQRPMNSPEKLSGNIWFHLLHVPKTGWLRTGYQGCIRAVRRKIRELKPDLVHGQGTERDCAISAVFSGFPNVVTIHGNMTAVAQTLEARIGSFNWCAALLERFTLPRTLGVFCNSAYTEAASGRYARQTWRVPNALRREFFQTPLPSPSPIAKPILLNIGVISPYKRQLVFLEVAEALHREGHSFELQFIGIANARDKYAATFLQRIEAAARSGFARYLGTKSLSELIAALDAASALIHVPSEESFGLVVAEALARNLKLFGTKIGGVIDIATGIEGAELFPLEDSSALKSAIAHWLRSDCPRPKSAAREMQRRYDPAVIATSHAEIYRTIIASR